MFRPIAKSLVEDGGRYGEIDPATARVSGPERGPVALFERGAGEDQRPSVRVLRVDEQAKAGKPRGPIPVVEGNSSSHLLFRACAVVLIGVDEGHS